MQEQARVSGKTSVSRLSVQEAVEALSVEVGVLRERIKTNAVPHECDEHGRVWVLVGASSNVPDIYHNRRRTPRDQALIQEREAKVSNLDHITGLSEGPEQLARPS